MSYSVVFVPSVEGEILALPPGAGKILLEHIARLAADPVELSEPGESAFEGSQTYPCWGRDGEAHWRFTIVFAYASDEQFIIITAVDAVQL